MSDIIRMARRIYGPQFDQMLAEAGDIKMQYMAEGGDPKHVVSPERLDALMQGGPAALEQEPAAMRGDGSVAGPYVPTEMALAMNMIEPGAVPAVLAALNDGVTTVSSGVDGGVGYAIGRSPDGRVVRVER